MPKAKPPVRKPVAHDPYSAQRVKERKHYARLYVAARQALALFNAMEEAGALRLPFIGYDATVVNLREALEADK